MAKTFDGPPTLERSGSEHRRAVTSLALLERARAWEWVKDPLFASGGQGSRKKTYVMTIEEKKVDKEAESVWAKFAYTASDGKTYQVDYYNLDVIISVGYRVKSVQGTKFRIWATSVLRQYLLQGYSVNRHLIVLQENMDKRMTHIEDTQAKQQQQLDFFIRTSTPPAEMVFFEGDFYTARVALENLVSSANHRVIIIDGYVSSLTLPQQSYRRPKMAKRVP